MIHVRRITFRLALLAAAAGLSLAGAGCQTCADGHCPTAGALCHHCAACPDLATADMPRELTKTAHPTYTIESPDVLLIDAVRLVSRLPYRIQALDTLTIRVAETLPGEPIDGTYAVTAEGTVNLGPYGSVRVAGLTVDEAREAVRKHLVQSLKAPRVVLDLAQPRGVQQIRGEHLVTQDGTVTLGVYGSVPVAGLTIAQARDAVEARLSQFFVGPEVSVTVAGYNSKVYYVIFDAGGQGQQIVRFPVTGNETVLDAIGQVNGLPPFSSMHVWVARPAPAELGCDQILPVDWRGITECGRTATNYQVLPGDRIYVKADGLVTFDNWVAKVIRPFERMFGVTLLGAETVRVIQGRSVGGF